MAREASAIAPAKSPAFARAEPRRAHVRAFVGNPLQRARQLRLPQDIAGAQGRAIGVQKDARQPGCGA